MQYCNQLGEVQMDICLRYATAADNLLLAQAGRRLFFEAFAALNSAQNMAIYLAESFGPEKQASELEDPDSVTKIAEVNGKFAGYVRLKEGKPALPIPGQRPIELVRIYTEREILGQGVGSHMMQASLEEAARRGYDVIWLGVWQQNPSAIRFYERWGYITAGTQIFRMGDDLQTDNVMYRRVTDPLMP